jgi:hypothetical protein
MSIREKVGSGEMRQWYEFTTTIDPFQVWAWYGRTFTWWERYYTGEVMEP